MLQPVKSLSNIIWLYIYTINIDWVNWVYMFCTLLHYNPALTQYDALKPKQARSDWLTVTFSHSTEQLSHCQGYWVIVGYFICLSLKS